MRYYFCEMILFNQQSRLTSHRLKLNVSIESHSGVWQQSLNPVMIGLIKYSFPFVITSDANPMLLWRHPKMAVHALDRQQEWDNDPHGVDLLGSSPDSTLPKVSPANKDTSWEGMMNMRFPDSSVTIQLDTTMPPIVWSSTFATSLVHVDLLHHEDAAVTVSYK